MLRMLTYPKHSVSSVCFNADGNKLVSGSFDQTLKVWSIGSSGTFECESTLRVDVQSVSFSPNNVIGVQSVAVGGVQSVCFSPNDNVIAAGCDNGKIYLVDAVAGEVKSTLAGHSNR